MVKGSNVIIGEHNELKGQDVIKGIKKLQDVRDIFLKNIHNENHEEVIYQVEIHDNGVKEGEEGLFFGTTHINPGGVQGEFYMTRGHFHKKIEKPEYYWGIEGRGLLLCVDLEGNLHYEEVQKGTLHYIPGGYAHRLINIGNNILSVGACWPSDAGHNYDVINENNFFGYRVMKDGESYKIVQFK